MTPYLTERTIRPPLIHKRPSPLLGLVVVIPCFDEEFLQLSLMSLKKCARPKCDVEVVVVVNDSEVTPTAVREKNRRTYEQAIAWSQQNSEPHLRFYPLHETMLPRKQAGVGLARKIGMDEACYRLEKAFNPRGIIACFDADSRCDPNYFRELERHFFENPKAQACGVYFEHPLSGCDFGDETYAAITEYELHLRYYVHAQRWAGFPHAWQTIGSSMAVRCEAYQKQGGMNRRQAGEDFYFLQKFIPLGNYAEVTSTRVIPSPRPSHRVPFGTGKAVGEWLKSGSKYLTYAPQSFSDLRIFLKNEWPNLYEAKDLDALLGRLPEAVRLFLQENNFAAKLAEIQAHTSSQAAFEKRLWRWFDAFLLMKYVHFARARFYPEVSILEAAHWLLGELGVEAGSGAKEMLLAFREMDRQPITGRSG